MLRTTPLTLWLLAELACAAPEPQFLPDGLVDATAREGERSLKALRERWPSGKWTCPVMQGVISCVAYGGVNLGSFVSSYVNFNFAEKAKDNTFSFAFVHGRDGAELYRYLSELAYWWTQASAVHFPGYEPRVAWSGNGKEVTLVVTRELILVYIKPEPEAR